MNYRAFTLIELSISITIIAFILSCIFIGNNIQRAAKVRDIIKEQEIYMTAIDNFKNTYNAVPGDMINATSSLNIAPGVIVAGNGNGNGLVDTAAEKFLLPQHLQAASFIIGYYDGLTQVISSTNNPNIWLFSPFNQVIFNLWRANEDNILYYSKNNSLNNGSINPTDAASIDTKIDDGNATKGYVYVMVASSTYDCIRTLNGSPSGVTKDSTYTGGDANYSLTAKLNECELLFGINKSQN